MTSRLWCVAFSFEPASASSYQEFRADWLSNRPRRTSRTRRRRCLQQCRLSISSLSSSGFCTCSHIIPISARVMRILLILPSMSQLLSFCGPMSGVDGEANGHYRYVQFYLDLMADKENVPLLQHLALKAKTVRDAEGAGEVCLLSRMHEHVGTNRMDSTSYRTCISWQNSRRSS